MKNFLSIFLCLSLVLQNTNLLAAKARLQSEEYKDVIFNIFSASKKIKEAKEKRLYLKESLARINGSLKKLEEKVTTEEEKETLEKSLHLFLKFEKDLMEVSDNDLDRFSDYIIQRSTEQAFILGIIILIAIGLLVLICLFPRIHKTSESTL